MSDDELARLRADLEVLERYQGRFDIMAGGAILNLKKEIAWHHLITDNADLIRDEIANLETAADPWREAKGWISSWRGQGDYPVVVSHIDHLTAENADLKQKYDLANSTIATATERLNETKAENAKLAARVAELSEARRIPIQIVAYAAAPGGPILDPAKPGEDRTVRSVKYVDGGPLKPRDVSDEMNEILGDDDPIQLNPKRAIATAAKIIADDPTLPDELAGALMQMCGAGGAKPYEVCDE